MPIHCVCPNGHALRVKDKLAGKSGTCPTCQAEFLVPAAGPVPVVPPGASVPVKDRPAASPPPAAPPAPSEAVEWRMARPDGQQFGPTVPMVFAQWIEAGRVTGDTLVWRTGWPEWRRADAAGAELPAPLPEATEPPPLPAAGVTLPPPPTATAAPAASPAAPGIEKPTVATSAYSVRRRQQARQRRNFSIALGLVCLVLALLLVGLMMSGPPAGAPVIPN
ncbi:hypothetical protein Pla108_08850 [Botrimarina colliarenosi]|uniref:GYF domain-containing protein n=1 Tax=Botrimarina colliarenosi TaxID=2528001 RepID=A0A5C6ALM6_9BACT|nr:DUF4339 domain-containing protein [Botrimarina colliarenosi]TWT99941.1 hypothetical protein Pla108_08850 [Botrimarina colliarenosi]